MLITGINDQGLYIIIPIYIYILGVVLEEKKCFFVMWAVNCLLAWMVKLDGGGGKNKG